MKRCVRSDCFNIFLLAVQSPEVVCRFDELAAPQRVKIKANAQEDRTLATLRDKLQPNGFASVFYADKLQKTK